MLVGYPRACASEEAVSEALGEVSIIRGSRESGEETCQSTRKAGQSQREDSPGPTRDAAARAALCGKVELVNESRLREARCSAVRECLRGIARIFTPWPNILCIFGH